MGRDGAGTGESWVRREARNTQEGMFELVWVVNRKKVESPAWAEAWGSLCENVGYSRRM